ncbi:MAG: undecaprenyl-diphosphate phosphatase [Clostridia bacterium]|nr:undecaprenyl-diphosphate phosphatase [Clostridia bacterium]
MQYLQAIILGIIQGLTEFLPVSSSGHLSVAQHFMGISGVDSLSLAIMLHFGTLIAVFIVFYKTFLTIFKEIGKFLKELFTGKLQFKEISDDRRMLYMLFLSCLPLLALLIPIGKNRKIMDIISYITGDKDIFAEGIFFIITAILLLVSSYIYKKRKNDYPAKVNSKQAFAIGFAQLFATLPGISRSGATITTGMLSKVDKEYMVRYSFVLGTPAILAANLMDIKDLAETGTFDFGIGPAILGIVVACIVGVLAIKLTEFLVKKDKFKLFGYYCLILGTGVIIAGIVEKFI